MDILVLSVIGGLKVSSRRSPSFLSSSSFSSSPCGLQTNPSAESHEAALHRISRGKGMQKEVPWSAGLQSRHEGNRPRYLVCFSLSGLHVCLSVFFLYSLYTCASVCACLKASCRDAGGKAVVSFARCRSIPRQFWRLSHEVPLACMRVPVFSLTQQSS